MLGWRDGIRIDIREPRRSWLCISLLSRNRDTFIKRGFGVLKMVRFSRQRALLEQNMPTHTHTQREEKKRNRVADKCSQFIYKHSSSVSFQKIKRTNVPVCYNITEGAMQKLSKCTNRLNRRKTTQIMTNISAMPARIPIMAGSMYLSGSRESRVTVCIFF